MDWNKILQDEIREGRDEDINNVLNEQIEIQLKTKIQKIDEIKSHEYVVSEKQKLDRNLKKGFYNFFQTDKMKKVFLVEEGNKRSDKIVIKSFNYKVTFNTIEEFTYEILVEQKDKGAKHYSFYIQVDIPVKNESKIVPTFSVYNLLEQDIRKRELENLIKDIEQYDNIIKDIKKVSIYIKPDENCELYGEFYSAEEILNSIQ